MKKQTLYLAGKMRRMPYYNFPAFDRAAKAARLLGFEVISPAEIDRQMGFDPMTFDHPGARTGTIPLECFPRHSTLRQIVRRDLHAVMRSQGVLVISGWNNSVGATAEVALALFLQLPIYRLTSAGKLKQIRVRISCEQV